MVQKLCNIQTAETFFRTVFGLCSMHLRKTLHRASYNSKWIFNYTSSTWDLVVVHTINLYPYFCSKFVATCIHCICCRCFSLSEMNIDESSILLQKETTLQSEIGTDTTGEDERFTDISLIQETAWFCYIWYIDCCRHE